MPRQRIHYRRTVPSFPDDFPRTLERLKESSGLSWSELARRLGTSPLTIRRWRAGARPDSQHLLGVLDIAHDLGLGHLFPLGRDRQFG